MDSFQWREKSVFPGIYFTLSRWNQKQRKYNFLTRFPIRLHQKHKTIRNIWRIPFKLSNNDLQIDLSKTQITKRILLRMTDRFYKR